ncbi:AMP-binding protein, partial [Kitasatospora nipponensis]|uniref:AMP-binding protein n=1 Tax=Kitasatospora nipponensis TaxID=258049 RepID=UPI0031D0034D
MLAPVAFAPERPALVESHRVGGLVTTTYRELADRVERYAAALLDLGLDIGDRVILESDTSGHAIALLLACSKAG